MVIAIVSVRVSLRVSLRVVESTLINGHEPASLIYRLLNKEDFCWVGKCYYLLRLEYFCSSSTSLTLSLTIFQENIVKGESIVTCVVRDSKFTL